MSFDWLDLFGLAGSGPSGRAPRRRRSTPEPRAPTLHGLGARWRRTAGGAWLSWSWLGGVWEPEPNPPASIPEEPYRADGAGPEGEIWVQRQDRIWRRLEYRDRNWIEGGGALLPHEVEGAIERPSSVAPAVAPAVAITLPDLPAARVGHPIPLVPHIAIVSLGIFTGIMIGFGALWLLATMFRFFEMIFLVPWLINEPTGVPALTARWAALFGAVSVVIGLPLTLARRPFAGTGRLWAPSSGGDR